MITHWKLSPGSHISRLVNQGIEKLPPSKICRLKTPLKMFSPGASAAPFNPALAVRASTRGRNILDQILTNMPDLYNDVQHLPPIGRSEHQSIILIPKMKQKIKPSSRRVRLTKHSK